MIPDTDQCSVLNYVHLKSFLENFNPSAFLCCTLKRESSVFFSSTDSIHANVFENSEDVLTETTEGFKPLKFWRHPEFASGRIIHDSWSSLVLSWAYCFRDMPQIAMGLIHGQNADGFCFSIRVPVSIDSAVSISDLELVSFPLRSLLRVVRVLGELGFQDDSNRNLSESSACFM